MRSIALCVSDALFSAKTGRGLQVTEDDLHLFLFEAHYKDDDLTVEIVQEIAANPLDRGMFLACRQAYVDSEYEYSQRRQICAANVVSAHQSWKVPCLYYYRHTSKQETFESRKFR